MLRRFGSLLLVSILLAPGVAAQWRGPGTVEPDTAFDVAHGSMWLEPDVSDDLHLVYLNGFQAVAQTALNPNSGTLGSRLLTPGLVRHHVMVGVWKDCNGDGYIGTAEGALQEYRAELLSPESPCRSGGLHNDGAWISEMIAIGAVDPCEYETESIRLRDCPGVDAFAANERVFYANGTMVWADLGAPGEVPRAECVVAPLPRGTTSGTGMLLRYVDCHAARNLAQTVNAVDGDGSLGLVFEDPEKPHESSSLLNHAFPRPLLGHDGRTGVLDRGTDAPAVTVWDCSDPKGGVDERHDTLPRNIVLSDPSGGHLTGPRFPLVIVGVYFEDEDGDSDTPGTVTVPLTDGEGSHVWAPPISITVHDATQASLWDTAAYALDGARGDCDPATHNAFDNAHPGERIEKGDAIVSAARKDRVSLTFKFYDGHRGFHPSVDFLLGETAPSDAGLLYRRQDRGGAGPMWTSPDVEQTPLLFDRSELEPEGARFVTYYAHLGLAARTANFLLSAGSAAFTYGEENCGDTRHGEQNGWVCDGDAWWLDALGEDARPRYAQGEPYAPVPGDLYHLRDVDCYDGRVAASAPVHASLTPDHADCG